MRNGERSGPVKNGDSTVCARTRSLRMFPAPAHLPPMQPEMYEGARLLRLFSCPVGSLAGLGTTDSATYPSSCPVTTLPGLSYPGRPPLDAAQVSHSQAMIPSAPTVARWSTTQGTIVFPRHLIVTRKLDAHRPSHRL